MLCWAHNIESWQSQHTVVCDAVRKMQADIQNPAKKRERLYTDAEAIKKNFSCVNSRVVGDLKRLLLHAS